MNDDEYSLLHCERFNFYVNSMLENQDQIEGRIVYDMTRTNGLFTLIAVKKAKAAKCYTLIDKLDRTIVENLLKRNGCEDKVELITSRDEEEALKADVILNDCISNASNYFSRLLQVVETRDRCLARVPSGLILPNEYYVYFHGITNEALMTDVKSRWKFPPYELDYTFLDDLSPREILTGLGDQSRAETIISTKCLLRQINLNTLSLGDARAFSTPFFLASPKETEGCITIHAFSLHFEASLGVDLALKYHQPWQDEPCHVMPLPNPIVLSPGGFIRGVFTLGIREEDETIIDWTLTLDFKHPLKETLQYGLREYLISPSSLYS